MNKIILLLVLAASPAWATKERPPEPPPPPQAHAEADAEARAKAAAEAEAAAQAQAQAQAEQEQTATGGDVDLSIDGSDNSSNTTSTSNESNFFALSTTFPQVSGCFKGKQGGAAGGGGGVWFGGHGLDLNCFLTSIAEAEPDIEVAARLKCGSKAFRNAIAFQEEKRDRQLFCVNYMTLKHRNELSALRERAEFLLQERSRIEQELTERNTLLSRQCAEQIDRSESAWLECLAK